MLGAIWMDEICSCQWVMGDVRLLPYDYRPSPLAPRPSTT